MIPKGKKGNDMRTIRIDTAKKCGEIRPLNGVGGGPVTGNFTFNAIGDFKDAGIPFGRTHDIEYPLGAGEYVDIHCVFPDFDKDVNDPASYNFAFTDEYLKAMCEAGTKPFYRLGSTIEHQPVKRYIHPPKNSVKWGEICSHIVSHYNEGWANGFHMGIEYWEIWNEPDLTNRCWTGTHEEFFALYDAAAPIIKRDHPDVKVGGCAFTSPTSGMCAEWLAHVKESGAPVDFFSWHGYIHTPEQARSLAETAQKLLDKYGFSGVESIFDEWNYVWRWDDSVQKSLDLHGTAFGAAFTAAVVCTLQHTNVDKAMYYDVQSVFFTSWNGMFAPTPMGRHGAQRPLIRCKPYYTLYAWNQLKLTGGAVAVECDKDLYAAAADGENGTAALISFYNDDEGLARSLPAEDTVSIELDGRPFVGEAWVVDEDRTWECVPVTDGKLTMKGGSTAFVKTTRG